MDLTDDSVSGGFPPPPPPGDKIVHNKLMKTAFMSSSSCMFMSVPALAIKLLPPRGSTPPLDSLYLVYLELSYQLSTSPPDSTTASVSRGS